MAKVRPPVGSGAGTNLKVGGGTGPKQKWGHRSGAKRLNNFLFGRAPSFDERFRDGHAQFG